VGGDTDKLGVKSGTTKRRREKNSKQGKDAADSQVNLVWGIGGGGERRELEATGHHFDHYNLTGNRNTRSRGGTWGEI